MSFPGEQRKEEEEEEERPEEAGSDGVVPGEEITIHLALMQVPPEKQKKERSLMPRILNSKA